MKKLSLNLILITTALFLCTQTVQAAQNSAATVHIDVDTATAEIQTYRTADVGEIVDVDIVINGAVNLKTFNLVVKFPQDILQIQEAGVTKGGFFPYPQVSPTMDPALVGGITLSDKLFFIKDLDTPGKAQVTGIVISSDDVKSGAGVLFHLRFEVLSTEPANLQFLVEDTQILQDNTGARPEAIDNPVTSGKANGASINSILCDINGDGFVSIIGDVPPFVDCVFFENCPGDIGDRCDINGDGFVCIIGDVRPFVDCVFFENCPE